MKRLFKKVLPTRFKNFKDKASTSCCSKFNEVIVNGNAADDDAVSNELYDITDDQLQNLEYEEITLYRPSRNTRLGLTLWYENDGDMETNIFVSKIESGSLVDLDGRMHAGDQILQICGMDVHTKNQAVELLTHCNRIAKFLVARSLPRIPVTASMMSTISLPQQELIKPEYINSVESQRICEEESDVELMPVNHQLSQEDSGISRLTGDESDSVEGVLGGRKKTNRNGRPPAQSEKVGRRRRLCSTNFDHVANVGGTGKFVGKHLSCGDVVSEFDHVTSDFGVRSSPGGVHQRPPSSLPSGRFASENSFFGGSDARPSSNLSPTFDAGHVTSETTLIFDRSGGDVPPTTILRAQSARENLENAPHLHKNYENNDDERSRRSVKLDLMNLRKEMADMQMECDRLIEAGEFFERRRKEERERRRSGSISGPKMIRQTRSIHVQYPENQQQRPRNLISPDDNDHSRLHKISSNTTSSSAYNTGGDSNPSTSVPTTPQQQQTASTTTVKFDDEKICFNDGSNRATIYTTRQTQATANCCSPSPGRQTPMNSVTSTRSAPNVSKIRSTSVALSKSLLSKTFYQTKTIITSEPNTKIEIDPNRKFENHHQTQRAPFHRPTSSISQPSVFIPDRRPPKVEIWDIKKSKSQDNNENAKNSDQSNLHILTDAANNLGKTILLKQRLLRQAMIRQAYQLKMQQEKEWAASQGPGPATFSPYGRFEPKILAPAGQHRPSTSVVYPATKNYVPFSFQNFAAQENRVEWKLKKRADGSRYISRRVVRNKMLKTRAEQINSMRTGMSSADDDAYSELKTGRYWTREERKRHFERSKERKRRQEELFRRKMLALAQSSEQTVLRLYQKNQHKRQGHELLDNFTTIQEYLSRDTRTVNDKISLGILTVTTV